MGVCGSTPQQCCTRDIYPREADYTVTSSPQQCCTGDFPRDADYAAVADTVDTTQILDDDLVISRLRKIFEECDKDCSGELSLSELILFLQADKELAKEYGYIDLLDVGTDEDIANFFARMDKDGNLHVTWEEFKSHIVGGMTAPQGRRHCASAWVVTQDFRVQSNSSPVHEGAKLLTLENMATTSVDVQNWNIDYWTLTNEQSLSLVHQALKEFDCFKEVPIPVEVLCNFVETVRGGYRKNPYHNFQHALATFHYTFKMIVAADVLRFLISKKAYLFSAVVASICHDLDHRGRNTGFEVSTLSELVIRYGDDSPLERHSIAKTFGIAFAGGAGGPCNIFTKLSSEVFTQVRKCVTESILATDMARHQCHIGNVKSQQSQDAAEFGGESSSHLIQTFLHMADISNSMMPFDTAKSWAMCVTEEFSAQVRDETTLGIPVTKMMDGLTTPSAIAKCQLGFIDFVITPFANPVFDLYPGLAPLQENLLQNRKNWSMDVSAESREPSKGRR